MANIGMIAEQQRRTAAEKQKGKESRNQSSSSAARQTSGSGSASSAGNKNLEQAFRALNPETNSESGYSSVDRSYDLISGGAKTYGSGFVNAAGSLLQKLSPTQRAEDVGAMAETAYKEQLRQAQTLEEQEFLRSMLEKNQQNRQTIRETRSAAGDTMLDAAKTVYGAADKLNASGAQNIESAKQDLGTLGRLAVDVGVAGGQMAADMAIGAATGGGALLPMFLRSAGSGAQEARQAGAEFDEQLAYGLGSGALSVATEKIANVAEPFKKAFGDGVLENAIPGVIRKLSGSAAGKAALSMISEGGEEMVEDLLQPILQRATYDPEALVNYKNADYWTNMLYDGLVGAALGGFGSGVEAASSITAGNRLDKPSFSAGEPQVMEEGNRTGAVQNGAEGVSGGIMEQEAQRLFGQQKTASTGETVAYRRNYDPLEAAAIRKASKKFTNVVAGFDTSISDFFSKWKSGRKSHLGEPLEKLYIGKVTDSAKAKMSELLGYDVKSGDYIITADNVKHIMDEHGNDAEEIKRGNIPLSTISMDSIADIVARPDRITLGAEEDWEAGRKGLQFEKDIGNGTVVYVQFDNFNRGTIEPRTMYIRKGTSTSTVNAANNTASTYTPKAIEPEAPADTVSQNAENGKRDILSEILFGGKRVDQSTLTQGGYEPSFNRRISDLKTSIDSGKVSMKSLDVNQWDDILKKTMVDGTFTVGGVTFTYEQGIGGYDSISGVDEYGRNGFSISGDYNHASISDVYNQIISKKVPKMGDTVGPNQAYIDAKSSIAGSQPTMQSGDELPMTDDGLGAANAGSLNSDYERLQAQSDSFHPVNPNSAQRIMNDQQRAPSEVPTVNPDTGKNIGKTVSTILNSPLTSPEMATQIESAVADGQFDYIPVTDKDANLRAQQDLSNRGLQTVADSFIAKVELGQRITKNDTASAIAAYNQAVADGNHALAFDLMTAIADAAHDSAQVVQSMNLMNRLTPEGRLLTLRKYVDKLNRQQRRKPGRQAANTNATQEQVDAARTNYVEQATGFRISDELAANYLMAETDAERAAAWDSITTDIASQIPSTFREKANFWRYTSMLLNPTTHVRNFEGNAIQAGARTIKNGVGAVIERAVVKDASQRTKAVVLGKEGKALRDFAKSQYEADKSAAMGAGKYSDASAAGINREIQDKRKAFQGSNPLSKAVQAVGDFNTRLLDLGDVIFNKSAYVDSFAQALKAKGVTAAEAAGGAKADLVAQARAYAIEEAQKATYRNTTALSEYLSKKGRYDEVGSIADKVASIAVDAFMPFRRTPANILTTGMDYSPVGLAKAITYDAYQVKAGNMSAADMVDHLSAGLTGTGILALGAYLAAEGLLKVRTGDDDREKEYNQDRGMQDYSLQIGDNSYTLDWAVPAAMPLFAGAAIMESAGEGGSGFDAVMDAMGGIGQVVLETSMLSSLNDFISNISYADDKFLYAIDRTVTSYAGQYIPTVGSKIASAMDDTVRKSYVEKGTGQLASDLGYFAQSMEKKIPGARENLQPKVNLWGNEVSNGEVGDRLLQSFLSPGYFKTVDTSDLDKELRRLAEATGSSAVYPAEVEKSFKVGGETKNLTAEEYTKYAKAVGQARYQAVSALTGNSGYKKLTDEEKAKAVSYAYEYATVKGKQAISSYKPSDTSFAKGAMNSVLPIDSYILYKITADKDGSGSVSGTESAKALQSISGLTDQQRWQEWARLNDAKDKADKASAAGLTVGEYASMKEKADANGDGRVTKEEAMKALGSVKNRVDLWDIICTTSAKNPYK